MTCAPTARRRVGSRLAVAMTTASAYPRPRVGELRIDRHRAPDHARRSANNGMCAVGQSLEKQASGRGLDARRSRWSLKQALRAG